jgi:transposase
MHSAALRWRKQYLHLRHWERGLSEQTRLHIREGYRMVAARMAETYATLYLEDFDLREVAERPDAESEEIVTASSGYRQMASPSLFRAALLNACRREGVRIAKLDAALTTRACQDCGYDGKWDQAESLMHRCERCGALWDQDQNAAANLLARGLSGSTENQQDSGGKPGSQEDRSQTGGKEAVESML